MVIQKEYKEIMSDDLKMLKELIETKLESIEIRINSNHEIQNEISKSILKQTTYTNGRVTKLEDEVVKVKESNINYRNNDCPRIADINKIEIKIEKINETVNIFKIIKDNPKISIIIITMGVVVVMLSLISIIIKIV